MYGYEWTDEYGIFQLTINAKVEKEIRPVFKEELDFFGLDKVWQYPDTKEPLLWAEGIRRYVLNGECVAEAKGGGFYTKPEIDVKKNGLILQSVDIKRLWQVNETLMQGLEQKAIHFIREQHEAYATRGYAFVAAFSGGKDSLAMLDLISKALAPTEFKVIFNNTGMELSATYLAVEEAKKHWSNLAFYEASSHLSSSQTWDEFGPPGRRMRWCCAVHKSVPTILALREITGNYDVQAVVFDGVRAEESTRRAGYDEVSDGAKNVNQVNCSPILKWNSAEVFIYLLHNNILLNRAYKYGLNRVGCTVCPLSAQWRDSMSNAVYKSDISPLLNKVEQYTKWQGIKSVNQKKYIEANGWRTRMGGRNLPNGGNRIEETISNDTIAFKFKSHKQRWENVSLILGAIVEKNTQIINHREYHFEIDETNGLSVSYKPYSQMDRFVLSRLRGVANKVAYCIGCKACVVQCPFRAFTIKEGSEIFIRESKCSHCGNCIAYTNGKGCLVAKSLSTTIGGNGMDLKGMNRYQTFGFRRQWLEHFFDHGTDCFSMGVLGTRQYDALKVWLREAGLITAANKGEKSGTTTPLAEKLKAVGSFNPLTWSIIWTNLAYNSTIAKWYMLKTASGESYEKADLVFMLGDDYSQNTRDSAVTALLETFRHSPIGAALKQGIPVGAGSSYKFIKQGWETPDSVAILYSLYLWAEATERYNFTLAQLEQARHITDSKGMNPASIFGFDPKALRDILQELALHYPDQIRVSFVADLDNIKLFPEIKSLDILDLALL